MLRRSAGRYCAPIAARPAVFPVARALPAPGASVLMQAQHSAAVPSSGQRTAGGHGAAYQERRGVWSLAERTGGGRASEQPEGQDGGAGARQAATRARAASGRARGRALGVASVAGRVARRSTTQRQRSAGNWNLKSPSVGRVSANPDTRFEPQSPTLIRLAAKALGRNQLVPYGPRDGQALGLLGPSGRQHKDSRTRTIGQDVPRTQNPSAPWAAPLLLLVPVERLPSSVMGRSLKTASSPPSSSLLVQQAATAACCDRQ